jgi:glycosyltransferase involved in cell wall biosynthesis
VSPSREGPGRIAFVLKGYPRLSETFIAQEIAALEQRGLEILIVSLRHPTDRATHPIQELIRAARLYLPEYLYQEPRRVWRGWWRARRLQGYRTARAAWFADLRRDPTPNRIRRFGQAMVLAAELPEDVKHLHAHFLHTPASVARYAAMMVGLGWTVSAHAKDIWTLPVWEKREKLAEAGWVVTCTEAGRSHLADLAPRPNAVALCYHGLDLERFPSPPIRSDGADGSDPQHPVIIFSVGRLVAKKGYDDLLEALSLLPSRLAWRFVHVGGGALSIALARQAGRLGLSHRIEWRGAQAYAQVLAGYRHADLFVLASKVARDGDRDGLPNVLMEAQSQRLACIATDVSGIPELIQDQVTGLLVPPDNPRALASALEALISDPARRSALAIAGELRVRGSFAAGSAIDALAKRFGLHPPVRASGSPPRRNWDGSLTAEALSRPSRVASAGIL